MFTLLDSVRWRQRQYRNPARLVTVGQTFRHWRGKPALEAMWNRQRRSGLPQVLMAGQIALSGRLPLASGVPGSHTLRRDPHT
jgi:hypothetical protein